MLDKLVKNIITIISITVFAMCVILSIIYVASVHNSGEHVLIRLTSGIGVISYLVIDLIGIVLLKKIENKIKISKKVKYILLTGVTLIYLFISCYWVNNSNVLPVDDSKAVNDIAVCFAKGDYGALRKNGYIEKYPNQMGTIFVIGSLYKIFRTTNYRLIQYANIVANVITFVFMYLIVKKLNKKYKVSELAYCIMYLTFVPLILLTTYVYGDYMGLAFSILGIYFIIDYKETKKIYKFILSAIFMLLSYITKMNYLIVIFAILIYLVMYLIQAIEEKNKKSIILNFAGIIVFAMISLMPFSLIKGYCIQKYEYREEQSLPTSVWLYLGMSESSRASGWYSELAIEAWNDTPLSHTTYPEKVKERMKDLITHPYYAIKFYTIKTVSGWIDPYFQSIWYNVGLDNKDDIMNNIMNSKRYKLGELYLKALDLIIYTGALVTVIKNRKNLNNELILLITIFVGGILFHTMWEMKSRYTLPYIIMLIPVSSIGIQNIVDKIPNFKFKKLNENNK